ncbi:Hypothetical protein GLP15_3484 [Giardia lamblia P15]|uniref:Leucine-rich repeat protein n=1 Tax=Giardia intestinalis (strain P15) TaxID=658858 RepID=E1F0F4_GIAIA|nr:Hypothetical protein GLP15_3484 [Giardia lamblia P15]
MRTSMRALCRGKRNDSVDNKFCTSQIEIYPELSTSALVNVDFNAARRSAVIFDAYAWRINSVGFIKKNIKMSSPTVRADPTQTQNKKESEKCTILDLSGQNIESLANLRSFFSPQIKQMNVSNNSLSSLNDLLPMFQLLDFDASYNMIVDIDQILPFPKLQTLNLSHNRIVRLTCTIPTSIRNLDLSYNNIYSLDLIAPVLSLKSLESLDIRENPLMKRETYRTIITNFPQLKRFNGKNVQDLDTSLIKPDELTLSELTGKNTYSPSSASYVQGANSATRSHNNSCPAAQKTKTKLVIDEQVILFSRGEASSSQTSKRHTKTHPLSDKPINESIIRPVPLSSTDVTEPSLQSHQQTAIEDLLLQRLVDQATMPDCCPTYTTAESQTDVCYKDLRRRTIYDFSDEDDDTIASVSDAPDVSEAKRLRRIKALLKNSEQIVDSTYIHTLQGQLQGCKQNEERLRSELDSLEQQVEKLRASNALLQSAVQSVETVSSIERQNFMLSNQIDEVVFLREQVKILDELLNRQEAASAVQFPVPEAIPEYLLTLNAYRRKLFHAMFDLRRLTHAKETTEASCVTAPSLNDMHELALKMEGDLIQLTKERNQLSEEHAEVLSKLVMTEHAARAFHDEATKYLAILLNVQTQLRDNLKVSRLDGLDQQMSRRICAYMNTNTTPSLDDAQKYILAATESASYRLAAQCSAIEAVTYRINDILSENQVVTEEREQLRQKLAVLVKERDDLQADNLLLKDAFRQQREERARLEELRASGYLDKAVSCTEIDLGDIAHGSTQTYLVEFLVHTEIQADPYELLMPKSVQTVRELFVVDDETQTGNLRELTNYSNSQFDTLPASISINVEHVEEEVDEEYQRLLQLKSVHDRSKGVDCTIIPSSILLKLHLDACAEDTSESALDAAIRSLLLTQSNSPERENSLVDGCSKIDAESDRSQKIHTGTQIEASLPSFKAIQCELLKPSSNMDGASMIDLHSASLNPLGPSTGPSDSSHIPRYRRCDEEQGSDFGSVEVTIATVFAATQVDAPDMKYFGVQTDEVDVAPYGTLAAFQSRISNPSEKLATVSDTRIASTQCDEVVVAFKSTQCLQCSKNESCCASESDGVVSDTPNTHNHVLLDSKNFVQEHEGCMEISIQTDESRKHQCQETSIAEKSSDISRLCSPPQSPYLYAIECERYYDILVECLHQQAQVLATRELEVEDMNEVISEVMKTISSAENKVSDYKRKLHESQDTILQLQNTITQLQGDAASAEAKGAEQEVRIKLLEELLGAKDGKEYTEAEIQTRLNLLDMKLLFAQMRVATSSVSTQYESQSAAFRGCDHREAVDASIVIQNLSGDSIKRSLVSRSCSTSKHTCKSEELRTSQFEPVVIPLTPPLSVSSSSDGNEFLTASFRNSPFVTLKVVTTGTAHEKGGASVSVFQPSTDVLQSSLRPSEKSSLTVQTTNPPYSGPETRVRFFCKSDDPGTDPVIAN